MSWPCLRLPDLDFRSAAGFVPQCGQTCASMVRTLSTFQAAICHPGGARRLLGRRGSSMCSRRRRKDGFRIMTDIVASERTSRDYVNALARGLEVIRVFTRHQPRMTLSEVARATDMTRATVRRFLLTLAQEGYVGSDGKYYRLTP